MAALRTRHAHLRAAGVEGVVLVGRGDAVVCRKEGKREAVLVPQTRELKKRHHPRCRW